MQRYITISKKKQHHAECNMNPKNVTSHTEHQKSYAEAAAKANTASRCSLDDNACSEHINAHNCTLDTRCKYEVVVYQYKLIQVHDQDNFVKLHLRALLLKTLSWYVVFCITTTKIQHRDIATMEH